MSYNDEIVDQLLYNVEKPGRYIGGELNSENKKKFTFHAAISYPDLYEVGMANNGIKILYEILNLHEDMFCERVFAVSPDYEHELRDKKILLHTLESKTPLNQLDMIGFNLSHELLMTNVLQILDLGGIPLKADDRKGNDPIVIVGGECTSNPSPMAAFTDAFFIGEGEEGIVEIAEIIKNGKASALSRTQILDKLSEVEGLIVTSQFAGVENEDKLLCLAGRKVSRRYYLKRKIHPEKPVVPSIRVSHDRAVTETARGCYNLCKFCHAGYYTLPYREYTPDEVYANAWTQLKSTGYNEITLTSLSISDHTQLDKILNKLLPDFNREGISISLPSLKVDKRTVPAIKSVSDIRQTSLTFAVETACDEMRKIIHKRMKMDDLYHIIGDIFNSGWKTVKLYFMIGLPGYKDHNEAEDVIAALKKINEIGRGRKKINVTISPFTPKPHTPFEFEESASREYLDAVVRKVRSSFHGSVAIKSHNIDSSLVETILSRGDMKLSDVIYNAYIKGCRLDSWDEYFKPQIWFDSLIEIIPDYMHYLDARTDRNMTPWSAVYSIREEILEGKRKHILTESELCRSSSLPPLEIDTDSIKEGFEEFKKRYELKNTIRLKFEKKNLAKHISHLDMLESMKRGFRIIKLPMRFSQGFNKHEQISTSFPLPIGVESECEIYDVELWDDYNIAGIFKLNDHIPYGIKLIDANVLHDARSIMASENILHYELRSPDNAVLLKLADMLLAKPELTKESKGKSRIIEFDKALFQYKLNPDSIELFLKVGSENSVRIDDFINQLLNDTDGFKKMSIRKINQYFPENGNIVMIK